MKRDVGVGGALGSPSSLERHSGPRCISVSALAVLGMSPVGGHRVLTAALRRTAIPTPQGLHITQVGK